MEEGGRRPEVEGKVRGRKKLYSGNLGGDREGEERRETTWEGKGKVGELMTVNDLGLRSTGVTPYEFPESLGFSSMDSDVSF